MCYITAHDLWQNHHSSGLCIQLLKEKELAGKFFLLPGMIDTPRNCNTIKHIQWAIEYACVLDLFTYLGYKRNVRKKSSSLGVVYRGQRTDVPTKPNIFLKCTLKMNISVPQKVAVKVCGCEVIMVWNSGEAKVKFEFQPENNSPTDIWSHQYKVDT